MKTVLINGGLGNQVFQYIFGRALEIATGEKVTFDDSYFFSPIGYTHSNGVSAQRLQLKEAFDLTIHKLSDMIEPTTWQELIKEIASPTGTNPHSVPDFLKLQYPELTLVAETSDFTFDGPVITTPTCIFNPSIQSIPGSIYYHGYWINKWWLYAYKDILLKELTFKPLTESHNLKYQSEINASSSIALHIRRFSVEGYNWDLSPEFYRQSILQMLARVENPTFFIFSDVLSYCKASYKELGLDLIKDHIIFVEGNEKEGMNFRDMQLMSMCQHMIIANSSFSYLAALLNTHPDKLVVNPTPREI